MTGREGGREGRSQKGFEANKLCIACFYRLLSKHVLFFLLLLLFSFFGLFLYLQDDVSNFSSFPFSVSLSSWK